MSHRSHQPLLDGAHQSLSSSQNPISSMTSPCPTKDSDQADSGPAPASMNCPATMSSCPQMMKNSALKEGGRRAVGRLLVAIVLLVSAGAQSCVVLGETGGALPVWVLWGLLQAATVAGIAAMSAARTVAEA